MSWQKHEAFIENLYHGRRTKGSGSQITQKGDVQLATDRELVECKSEEPKENPRKPRIVKHMEKVAREAYEEGLDPVLAYRYFDPSSTLASHDGFIDVVIRLARDDARRSEELRDVNV